MVERLPLLAGQDVDHLQLREEIVRLEDAVDETEHDGMLDERIARERLAEHVVETLRREALEVVPRVRRAQARALRP